LSTIWAPLKNGNKQLGHQKSDQTASREREHPGQHHIPDDFPPDRGEPFGGSDAHDGGGFHMRRADGDPEEGADQQSRGGGKIGSEALVIFQFDHVHSDRFDDSVASDGGSEPHDERNENHQPNGNHERGGSDISLGQSRPEEEHSHEFLSILGSVHKGHGGRSGDLRFMKEGARFSSIHVFADQFDDLDDHISGSESQESGQSQSIDDVHPLIPIDSRHSALKGDGGSGDSGDQSMGFRRGNPEIPRRGGPNQNSDQGGAQGGEGIGGISAEIHHFIQSLRNGGVDHRHKKNPDEVEDGGQKDRPFRSQGFGGNRGGDGVRRIGPPVNHDHQQDEDNRDDQDPVAGERVEEINE